MSKQVQLNDASNDGKRIIESGLPYSAWFEVTGTSAILFHRWNVDALSAKQPAKKGSAAKKTDDLESYVYRSPDGELSIPSEYFRMSIINAAKFLQDPRSPRKSAMDLFKAAIFPLDQLCSFGVSEWNLVDRRRVQIQRAGITRERPGLSAGWKTQVGFQVTLPEYVTPALLNETLQLAGRVIGVADFRPTFGRFQVTEFKVSEV